MKVEAKLNPSRDDIVDLFSKGLSTEAIVTIFAHCRVFYDGRAKSELGPGDRVIIIKPDGSFLIHQKEKREPVNWQPPGSSVSLDVREDKLILRSVRRKPKEILEVELIDVYLFSYFQAEDYEALALVGSEAEMADLVFKNPELIEEGFKPISKEKSIRHGIVDLLGKDKDGNIVILEFKRRRADLHAVSQLKRYVETMREEYEKVRGILVAPSLTSGARKLLKKEGLEFKKLNPPKQEKSRKGRQKTLFD
ncbi:endonuclease NucS [Thermococcus argininiproducens]|uniref:Endonuclease NucS n=1 Tax=Thermococcus argininiproducens TaxID=2866384 RepID=A0A9E7SDV2_9EURY|nr:endonuclease NucS [Thermococcus argininiproducens]USH00388.1 endonuclease NucS [Thermococcus argininiproducens]